MKITRKQLRGIIKEELTRLSEAKPHPDWNPNIVDDEKIYRRQRRPFEYKIVDEEWHARRISLGPDARWKNVQRFAKVVGKLNREFPSAMKDSKTPIHHEPSSDAEHLITRIDVVSEDDDTETIEIYLTNITAAAVSTFTLTRPSRVVIDIADADWKDEIGNENIPDTSGNSLVEKITVETIEDEAGIIARVEVFLTVESDPDHTIPGIEHKLIVMNDHVVIEISPKAEE
jgi:hypothetical protein